MNVYSVHGFASYGEKPVGSERKHFEITNWIVIADSIENAMELVRYNFCSLPGDIVTFRKVSLVMPTNLCQGVYEGPKGIRKGG